MLGVAAGAFGLLAAVLGWMGTRMAEKLDEIRDALVITERQIGADMASVSLRVALIEARCLACLNDKK